MSTSSLWVTQKVLKINIHQVKKKKNCLAKPGFGPGMPALSLMSRWGHCTQRKLGLCSAWPGEGVCLRGMSRNLRLHQALDGGW